MVGCAAFDGTLSSRAVQAIESLNRINVCVVSDNGRVKPMTASFARIATAAALAASFSLAATPALARGWGGGWGGSHRHHDRIDAGDVLAGILIIGGIAAVASAASKGENQRQEQQDYRDPRPRHRDDTMPRYGADDDRPEWREGAGIDTAVNRCIDEVNRGRSRVGGVESVNREANGWRVSGTTTANGTFSCTVDGEGRIRNVNVDGRAI